MIDRDQAQLVDIVDLLHRLAEAQAEETVACLELRTFHLDPLIGIGLVGRDRRYPMTDNTGSDHVRDELILTSVPRKQHGTRASPAVKLGKRYGLARRDIELILRNAGWPQHADHIGTIGLAKTRKYLR